MISLRRWRRVLSGKADLYNAVLKIDRSSKRPCEIGAVPFRERCSIREGGSDFVPEQVRIYSINEIVAGNEEGSMMPSSDESAALKDIMSSAIPRWRSTMPDYRQAEFLVSASSVRDFPLDEGREVAFAGRSNAGKSSLINALCRRRALARTSRTPGRTRLINFFSLADSLRLVDLPGYGYAKAPRSMSQAWGRLVEEYLHRRRSLVGVVLLMDIRHPLTALDRILLDGCRLGRTPLLVVLSKADKLASKRRSMAIKEVGLTLSDLFAEDSAKERSRPDVIGEGRSPPKVMAHSVPGKIGYEELVRHLSGWLEGE